MSNVRRLMSNCPHCGTLGFSVTDKWLSGSSSPATCSACGGMSYVRASESNATFVMLSVLLALAALVAFLAQSWWAFAAGVVTTLAFYAWRWHRATLVPISAESVASARTVGWLIFGALFAYVIYRGLLSHA